MSKSKIKASSWHPTTNNQSHKNHIQTRPFSVQKSKSKNQPTILIIINGVVIIGTLLELLVQGTVPETVGEVVRRFYPILGWIEP